MTAQLLLFNEDSDQQVAPNRTRNNMGLAAKARKLIREEGLYSYAMVVKASMQYDDEYVHAHFGIDKEQLQVTLNAVFNVAVGYQESLEDFLQNVKNIPGYGLQKAE